MKRIIFTLVLASLVLVFFYGCEKEGVRKVSVEMAPFNGGKLVIDGYSLNWSEGDGIAVQGGVYAIENSSVSVDIEDETLCALYPVSAMKDYANGIYNVKLPRVQTYQVENGKQVIHPLMAARGNNSLSFGHVCSLLKVEVPAITGMTVQYIDITTVDGIAPLSGEGQVTFTGETPTFAFSSGNTYPYVRLDCGEGVSGTVFYIVVPPIDSKRLKVTLTVKTNTNRYRHTVSQSQAASLSSGWCGPVSIPTFELSAADDITAPTNALCEYFSMGASTKVFFSMGNLQYMANGTIWRFANSQYEIIGKNNSYISNSYGDYIDLFGWWTSGINYVSPFETSIDDASYYYLNRENSITPELDWGANNISGTTGWRTPTDAEWSYLLSNHSVAHATVDTVKGIVILPDYWILPEGCSFNPDYDGFASNIYSIEEWNKMERYGALFLPAAGYRRGTTVYSINKHGFYWASTIFNPSNAYSVHFNSTSIQVQGTERHYGCSVRLVKDR